MPQQFAVTLCTALLSISIPLLILRIAVKQTKRVPVACPRCDLDVPPTAVKCPHCGALVPDGDQEL
jgi:hypothetical protein